MKKLLLMVLAIMMFGLVPATASAPNAIVNESFNEGTEDVFSHGAWGMLPLAAGHEGPGLKSIILADKHWGSSGHWYFADHGIADPEELWWRYWVQFPEGFYIEPPNRGKLPGVGGLYTYNCLGNRPSTPEEPCFSARMLFSRAYPKSGEPGYPYGPDDKTQIGFYVYHVDSPATRGDIWTWDPAVAVLDHGAWYCVEGHIDLNTPGSNNGVLEGWVDGAMAFEKNDIAFRRSGEDQIDIKSFWFDIYYGGEASLVDNEIWFDSLAFGPDRVGCDDGNVFEPPFRDDDGSLFEPDIIWLAGAGITQGCNPPTNDLYCPNAGVTRGQMAAFLTRALSLSDASGSDSFGDDNGSVFESSIESLAAAGITKGCNPPANDRFCPDRKLTRAEMATFLSRAFSYGNPDGNTFTDDDGSIFETAIEGLAAAGVTRGCNPPENDLFCPNALVTRAEMAAFLHRALD